MQTRSTYGNSRENSREPPTSLCKTLSPPPNPPPRSCRSTPTSQRYELTAETHKTAHKIAANMQQQLTTKVDEFIETERLKSNQQPRSTTEENSIQSQDNEDWACYMCQRDLRTCPETGGSSEPVGCESNGCNKWFHPSCAPNENYQEDNWECSFCPKFSHIEPRLPDFLENNSILSAVWGILQGEDIQKIVDSAHEETSQWKNNLFKIPSGKAGRDFIDEVKKTVDSFNSGGSLESVSMTMLMIIFPLILQKPSAKSKSKIHKELISKRLELWREGKLEDLLRIGRAIQKKLTRSKPSALQAERMFVRLMLQGKVSAALKWIGEKTSTQMEITKEVVHQLQAKHPQSSDLDIGATLKGPIMPTVTDIFENIDGEVIKKSAKRTQGSAGPSGMDSEGWARLLCSNQFRTKSAELCSSIADMAKKLSSKTINPRYLHAYVASRLIALDKNPGIRPIGIGEVLRRIVGKALTTVMKPELIESTGPIQVCAGLQGGIEAAIHAMRQIYEDESTDCILLVDADNAFNSLNRKAALNNIQYICPEIATYVINTYRKPSTLFVSGSDVTIKSEEGTTQGDTLAMGMYACSLMPLLIESKILTDSQDLQKQRNSGADIYQEKCQDLLKNVWYADDAAGGGKLKAVKDWWENLRQLGPLFGYHPKPSKTWLIVKEEKQKEAEAIFGKEFNISTEGRKYLGSFIGTDLGKEKFMKEQLEEWESDIMNLADIAKREPQHAYAAYQFGTSKRWKFVARTTPGISQQFKHLDWLTTEHFIPPIIGKDFFTENMKEVFSLPAKYGGLGITRMEETSDMEYENSKWMTQELTDAIYYQYASVPSQITSSMDECRKVVSKRNKDFNEQKKKSLYGKLSPTEQRQLDLASEKGASAWLTSLPLAEYGFLMNKQEFNDAVLLRYNFRLKNVPTTCSCGDRYSVDHALTCKSGGYVSMRHNKLRDLTGELLAVAGCKDIKIEPQMLPLAGEQLSSGSNKSELAQLDVSARGVWAPLDRAFFDIRVFHPQAQSNASKTIPTMYSSHEQEKKRKYNDRVLNIEKGTFTPLVFSTSGGAGYEASTFMKTIAQKIADNTNQQYQHVMAFVRRRYRFALLRTCIIALRGYRKRPRGQREAEIQELDVDLLSKN